MNSVAGLIRQLLRESPSRVLAWTGRAAVERSLHRWLGSEIESVGSLERARELKKICPVAGTSAGDYVARRLPLRGGGAAIVHVRFRGGDPARPFVQWVACDVPITSFQELRNRTVEAREAYAALKPRAVRIWLASGAGWKPRRPASMNQRWLAAPLEWIRRRRPLPLPAGFAVRNCGAREVYASYVREYDAYMEAHPKSRSWFLVESLDSLRACERAGALFALEEGRALCGLVALRRESTPWFGGWLVVESLIFRRHRGRGLAAPMHRAAYGRLRRRRHDFIWGTIDPRNVPSLRTARAVGREDLGGDWWVARSMSE